MKTPMKALPLIALPAVALPPETSAKSPEEKGLAIALELDRRGSGIPGAVQRDSAWELLSGICRREVGMPDNAVQLLCQRSA